jgi:hypothetical protein
LKDDCFIGSVFALYDILIDDDEDIRDIGAEIVSQTSKESLQPIGAQRALLNGLKTGFREEPIFLWNVVSRLTGQHHTSHTDGVDSLVGSSVPEQHFKIFRTENALFAREDPNIYTDVVEELNTWSSVFLGLPIQALQNCESETGASPIDALREWVVTELKSLRSNSQLEKAGPFDRKPKRALAWIMRVLYCANTVLAHFVRVAEALEPAHPLGPLETAFTIEQFDTAELRRWKLDNGLEPLIDLLEEFARNPPALGLHNHISDMLLSRGSWWLDRTKLDILSVQIAAMSRQPQIFLSLNP